MAIFWRVLPPPGSAVPSAVSEDEGLAGRNERTNATRGSFPRDPAHHQTQLGIPTRLIHSSPDPTKTLRFWARGQDVEDISRGEKSAFSLGEKSGAQTGTEHQNSTQKNTWNGASQQIQAKERPLFPDKFPIEKGEFPMVISAMSTDNF